MEIFQAVLFWIFGILSLLLCIYCIFEKSPKRLNIIYAIFASLITILIFNLKSPLLAVFHGLIFICAGYLILNTLTRLTNQEDKFKKAFLLNPKTLLSFMFAVIFTASFIPFVLYVFSSYKTLNPVRVFDFITHIYKGSGLGLILIFVLIITLITGISSIFNLKNLYKKLNAKEDK